MTNIKKALSALAFWDKLSNSEKKYITENTVLRTFDKGELIQNSCDSCLGMLHIISGEIRAYMISEEGREITLFRLENNDTCILSASCVISQITFDTQITAEKKCLMMIINAGALAKLSDKNIYVKCFIYELTVERFSSVMWTMQKILFEKFDRRLADFLINQYTESNSHEIHMTHEEIARQVNSVREVVARMLKRFEADSLVELKRGCVKLIDIEKLKKYKN